MLKSKDLILQSVNELKDQYEALNVKIFDLNSELKISRKLEKPHELKEAKKDRARILTVLNKKKMNEVGKG